MDELLVSSVCCRSSCFEIIISFEMQRYYVDNETNEQFQCESTKRNRKMEAILRQSSNLSPLLDDGGIV